MKRILFVFLVSAMLLVGCGVVASNRAAATEAPAYAGQYGVGGGAPSLPGEMPMPAPTMSLDVAKSTNGIAADSGTASPDRLVIKNADLTIVVVDPEKSMTTISKMAEDMGGFVVSSNLYQTNAPSGVQVPGANVVIRVPAEKLDEALAQIKSGASEVQSETVSGQDVTSQYVDLQSQLTNLEAAEAQLQEIMKNAEKTEDVLNVYNQLVSVRGQIEQIKGQMKYYEESAALSVISVQLVAEASAQPLQVGGWQVKGWTRDAVQSLLNFLQDFTHFLISLIISFIPKLLLVALVFGLPIWLVTRAVRNANRKRKAGQAAKEESK